MRHTLEVGKNVDEAAEFLREVADKLERENIAITQTTYETVEMDGKGSIKIVFEEPHSERIEKMVRRLHRRMWDVSERSEESVQR